MKHNMLHMKLKMAVCSAALLAFLPTSAYCGVCFLPDCSDEDLAGGGNMDLNEDTAFCESKGFSYYASGKCPQYYAKIEECSRDEHYLKCDAQTWCKQNGYNTTTCSIPKYVNEPCPSYGSLYKGCKTDNDRACKELNYTKTCPSGQKLKKTSGRCDYDKSYGTCCKPSGCPQYTSLTSSSYGTNGTDGCEYTCYYTCNMNCPSGTSTSNPGGCGGSTKNGCRTKTCYYPYKACCTPSCSSDSGCSCGTYTVSDGCGGTCTKCSSCCNSSSSNWCSYHGTCHGDCCKDGTWDSCDERCGGSGCSSGGGGGSSGGGSSGGGYSGWCCDDIGSYCGSYSYCTRVTNDPDCSTWISQCEASGGTASFDYCSFSSLNQTNCSARFNCT